MVLNVLPTKAFSASVRLRRGIFSVILVASAPNKPKNWTLQRGTSFPRGLYAVQLGPPVQIQPLLLSGAIGFNCEKVGLRISTSSAICLVSLHLRVISTK